MVSFTIVEGCKGWYAGGAYVTPNDQLMVHWVEHSLSYVTARVDKLLDGNLNTSLAQPGGKHDEGFGKLLRRQGENPRVVEIFYRAVTQTVLLF